ncbi:DUF488 family protein [Streptacidiphilus sp. 4-A2]|nr:DUF488 family protein [Streptacidiphilus sp. 4-A2]
MAAEGVFRVKRVYEPPEPRDGPRVLVDRLWPRGVSKERAAVDEWLKEVAPSAGLRDWYHHHREEFAEFGRRYRVELDDPEHSAAVARLLELGAAAAMVTLVTSVREVEHSHVPVLLEHLAEAAPDADRTPHTAHRTEHRAHRTEHTAHHAARRGRTPPAARPDRPAGQQGPVRPRGRSGRAAAPARPRRRPWPGSGRSAARPRPWSGRRRCSPEAARSSGSPRRAAHSAAVPRRWSAAARAGSARGPGR